MYELHIKHVVEIITGNTKDPGVQFFKRPPLSPRAGGGPKDPQLSKSLNALK